MEIGSRNRSLSNHIVKRSKDSISELRLNERGKSLGGLSKRNINMKDIANNKYIFPDKLNSKQYIAEEDDGYDDICKLF